MRYSVYVRLVAERDVAEAQQWYEKRQAGLAVEFHNEFVASIERLEESPLIYAQLHRGIRRAVMHRFPYLIWYQVQESQVTVLACTHGKFGRRRVAAYLRGR